ncbi:MAG: hypothetical protein M1826_000714 [Phylliscum demangeonii]|nr:MAG: hypothetical protein M1826_000714 [Phylliscum demangeonii]
MLAASSRSVLIDTTNVSPRSALRSLPSRSPAVSPSPSLRRTSAARSIKSYPASFDEELSERLCLSFERRRSEKSADADDNPTTSRATSQAEDQQLVEDVEDALGKASVELSRHVGLGRMNSRRRRGLENLTVLETIVEQKSVATLRTPSSSSRPGGIQRSVSVKVVGEETPALRRRRSLHLSNVALLEVEMGGPSTGVAAPVAENIEDEGGYSMPAFQSASHPVRLSLPHLARSRAASPQLSFSSDDDTHNAAAPHPVRSRAASPQFSFSSNDDTHNAAPHLVRSRAASPQFSFTFGDDTQNVTPHLVRSRAASPQFSFSCKDDTHNATPTDVGPSFLDFGSLVPTLTGCMFRECFDDWLVPDPTRPLTHGDVDPIVSRHSTVPVAQKPLHARRLSQLRQPTRPPASSKRIRSPSLASFVTRAGHAFERLFKKERRPRTRPASAPAVRRSPSPDAVSVRAKHHEQSHCPHRPNTPHQHRVSKTLDHESRCWKCHLGRGRGHLVRLRATSGPADEVQRPPGAGAVLGRETAETSSVHRLGVVEREEEWLRGGRSSGLQVAREA